MNTPFDRIFISKFLRGSCSDEEKAAFQAFLKRADTNEEIEWMRQIWENPEIEANNLLGVEDRIYRNVAKLIDKDPVQLNPTKKNRVVHVPGGSFWQLYPIVRYASVILIVLIPIIIIGSLTMQSPELQEIVYQLKETHNGQHLTFRLDDGTEITLNSNSTLRFPEHFSDSSREVVLTGEAFFDVAKDAKRPFTVFSGNVSTTALGTSFNIRCPSDSSGAEVSLVTGSVNVRVAGIDDNEHEIILLPNEQLVYDNVDKSYFTQKFDYLEVAGWKDGVLYFKEASLHEIIDRLETWYDANIELGGDEAAFASKEWNYTGTYTKASLENVLRGIGYSEKFSYEFKDNKNVTIYMN